MSLFKNCLFVFAISMGLSSVAYAGASCSTYCFSKRDLNITNLNDLRELNVSLKDLQHAQIARTSSWSSSAETYFVDMKKTCKKYYPREWILLSMSEQGKLIHATYKNSCVGS